MYRHFLDRGWIRLEEYRDARERWNLPPAKSGAGGNSNRTLVSYLGTQYLEMAFAAYYGNRLDQAGLGRRTRREGGPASPSWRAFSTPVDLRLRHRRMGGFGL